MNAEHSWADAPLVSHLAEDTLYNEFFTHSYRENGKCEGEVQTTPPPPQRLRWNLEESVGGRIIIITFLEVILVQ